MGAVTNCWHLEWEQVGLCILPLELFTFTQQSILINLEHIKVWEELTIETTYDHDFVETELAHSCSLSCGNWLLVHVVERRVTDTYLGPFSILNTLKGEVESLD